MIHLVTLERLFPSQRLLVTRLRITYTSVYCVIIANGGSSKGKHNIIMKTALAVKKLCSIIIKLDCDYSNGCNIGELMNV